ncbi:MAG: hypothetical protein V4563_18035 [Pseudomonadota bacterium]
MDQLIELTIDLMLEAFSGGDWPLAKQHYHDYIKPLGTDEHADVWSKFDSEQRAYLLDIDRQYLADQYRSDTDQAIKKQER